jgi:hypothetical protein
MGLEIHETNQKYKYFFQCYYGILFFVHENRYPPAKALTQARKSSVAKAKAVTKKDCSR